MGHALLAVVLALAGVNELYHIDTALTERVQAQARSYGLEYRVVVAVAPAWRARGIVDTRTRVRDNIVAIIVSPILLEEMDREALEGMFAHELAHPQRACGLGQYATLADEIACEHPADVQAAKWVGRRAVLRGLCQLRAISWDWRYSTDATGTNERIKRLHERTDISE
ncbi:MAG: hypothetical protein IT405_00750 [Candidatus Yanofskybacteria bacterium]|nr:hypothetical protein [Candidatus Yanofskybacteria bacterium]